MPSGDALKEWLTMAQVSERLFTKYGWRIAPDSWRKRCAEYGPAPIHIGRTPLWHYSVVDSTAEARPGQGARTDLKRKESA